MSTLARPLLGDGLLFHDLELLRRLRAAGHLRGLRPLEALVAIRRARGYGEGPPAMRRELEWIEREREAEKTSGPIPSTFSACPSCKGGPAWMGRSSGFFECNNCGFLGVVSTMGAK